VSVSRVKYVCVLLTGKWVGLGALRNSTEESPPWPVHVAATNYRDCECLCVGAGGEVLP